MTRPLVRPHAFLATLATLALLAPLALAVPGLAPPLAAQQDTTAGRVRDAGARDVSTYRDVRAAGDTAPTTVTAPPRAAPSAGAPAAAAPAQTPADAGALTARDTSTLRDTTATRDTTAARDTIARPAAPRGDTTAADSLTRDLTPEQCDTLVRRVTAGGEPPAGAGTIAMQTYVVPDGPPPNDLRTTTVMLRFRIGADGMADPASLTMAGSSDPAFRQRAIAALRGMQFRPAEYRGCVLPGAVEVPVHFAAAAVRAVPAAKAPAKAAPRAKPRAAPKRSAPARRPPR